MITNRITLSDSKEAIEVTDVPEAPICLRVRKLSAASITNGDHSDLVIQVVAYRVNDHGQEIDCGPVTGRTMHGGGGDNPDMPSLCASLTTAAVLAYVSKWIADRSALALPDELVFLGQ